MILYYLRNVYESLKFNLFRTFLTGLGVLIGIFSLVLILTLSDSFSKGITSNIEKDGINIGLINSITASDDVASVLNEPDVQKSIEFVQKKMSIVKSFTKDKDEELLNYTYNNKVESNIEYTFSNDVSVDEGENFKNRTGNVVIVRNNSEFKSNLKIGDDIVVYGINYEIIGFTSEECKDGIPILYFPESLRSVIKASNHEESCTFQLYLNNTVSDSAVNIVLEKLNESVPEGYKFVNISAEINKSIEETIRNISIFIALIAGISIIVAAINVANIMYISILEKVGEVAIYRALGMKRREVQFLFLIESVIIVLFFSIIGYILGLFIAYVILTILKIDIVINFINMFMVIILSMFIGILSGFRPAKKAADLNTATILK